MANARLYYLISPLTAERRRVRGEPLETQVAIAATPEGQAVRVTLPAESAAAVLRLAATLG